MFLVVRLHSATGAAPWRQEPASWLERPVERRSELRFFQSVRSRAIPLAFSQPKTPRAPAVTSLATRAAMESTSVGRLMSRQMVEVEATQLGPIQVARADRGDDLVQPSSVVRSGKLVMECLPRCCPAGSEPILFVTTPRLTT